MTRILKLTLRSLMRSPFFAIAVIGILAIGLGATTAVTSIVDAVLLKPLPFDHPERLAVVWETRHRVGSEDYLATPAEYFAWREAAESFDDLAAYTEIFFNSPGQEYPVRVTGLLTTPNFLTTLGVDPVEGRGFAASDAESGARDVVVVSHGFWQRQLAGAPLDELTVELDGTVAQVVGVLPPDFLFLGKDFEVLAVYAPSPEGRANRDAHFLTVVGRLAPGVGVSLAQNEMDRVSTRLAETYPDTNTDHGVRVVPLRDELVGAVEPALIVLLSAVACVLLITCANVANLLLARGATRSREMAIRSAFGASRGLLLRQLLGEGVVLGLMGGVAGLGVAWLGILGLRSLAPVEVPRIDLVSFDWRLFAFALLLSMVTGLLVSLLPALGISRTAPSRALGTASRTQGRQAAGGFVRTALVTAEVVLAVVLLIGAGLLLRSFAEILDEDAGFDATGIVSLDLSVPGSRLDEGDDPGAFLHRLLERVREEPRIVAAGATSHLPMSGEEGSRVFRIAGRASADAENTQSAQYRRISVGYPETLGIPLLRGRVFNQFDADLPGVALVNQTFSDRYFPGGDALGETLFIEDGADDVPREIVGVLGDVRHFGLDQGAQPEIYVPVLQIPWPTMSLVVKATGSPDAAAESVREALRAMDPGLPVANIRTLDDSMGRSVATERFSAALLALFAGVAVLLAAFGIYGVQAYLTEQMRSEIGIRMALGARAADVLRRVLTRGAVPVAIGLVVGVGLAIALSRVLENQLYQVSPVDVWTYVGVTVLLGGVALLACYLPARSALRIEPGRLFSE